MSIEVFYGVEALATVLLWYRDDVNCFIGKAGSAILTDGIVWGGCLYSLNSAIRKYGRAWFGVEHVWSSFCLPQMVK